LALAGRTSNLLLGVKRTRRGPYPTSANDPKRTSLRAVLATSSLLVGPATIPRLKSWGRNEAARLHFGAGGATAMWPLMAHAQQTASPVIGFLSSLAPRDLNFVTPAFHEGLNGAGFVEGRNVSIEYRWAEGDYHRLPALSADLVRQNVTVIAAISGTPAALAAKAATTNIPIVFAIGGDPITPGLVSSLGHPSGNVTGMSFYNTALVTKRLELARELVAKETIIGMLVNPENPPSVAEGTAVQEAAAANGRHFRFSM